MMPTFPKLPFPMALRIWKWSKLTVNKTHQGIIVNYESYVNCASASSLLSCHEDYLIEVYLRKKPFDQG